MSLQHLHARKRGGRSLEPYPARNPWMRFLDWVVYAVGIIGPIMTIPQLVLIYGGKQAVGVSAISFFAWALLDLPWIVYGIAHRERPIVVAYVLWFLCNFAVAVGAIIYGGGIVH